MLEEVDAMTVIIPAKTESEILASVQHDATADQVCRAMVERADACVNHLCGCK